MSTLVGAGTGNPLLFCSSLIGGNTLGILSQDTKALNYKYTKVHDADMIILVRKIDELQQKVVGLYYDYMTTAPINCDAELKRLSEADYDLCAALLTMLLREDHFSNGALQKRYEAGQVDAILSRMIFLLNP
jgi:hypothetical protein